MAHDDVNVVVYKILKYLYECKKAGKQPQHEDVMFNAALLRIPESYWMDILLELNRKGLIRGINSIITKDGTIVTLTDEFGITIDGMQYVDDNSMMEKASEYLGVTFVALLNHLINKL